MVSKAKGGRYRDYYRYEGAPLDEQGYMGFIVRRRVHGIPGDWKRIEYSRAIYEKILTTIDDLDFLQDELGI